MILLDLFSGIGGFHRGLSLAGFKFEKIYYSEIDKHAIANYKNNFKDENIECIGSVEHILSRGIRRPNIITFGSPCQDFSLAGNRQGLDGERSSLIKHALSSISHFRPDVFIWENVKGTFSSNSSEDFWAIIQAFANIGGYEIEWQLLNTAWVLPQNRERLYLVGRIAGKCRGEIFPITETGRLYNKTTESGERICENTYTIMSNSPNKLNGSFIGVRQLNKVKEYGNQPRQQNRVYCPTGLAPTISKGRAEDKLKILVNSATKSGYEVATLGDSIDLKFVNSKTRRGRVGKQISHTLDTDCNKGVIIDKNNARSILTPDRAKKRQNGRRIKEIGEPSFTLTKQDRHGIFDGFLIRKLTEIECERLQGFPDNWTRFGIYDDKTTEIAQTNRYSLIGNAVTVDIVQLVAIQILNNTEWKVKTIIN